ncbi:CTSC [Symbiodinium sp. CCMP2456]|nr:CTSC [Symbiodinium sp. CCMP2456]
MTEAERLVFLRRSLARARIQSLELESQRAQQERALAEAYAQRRENQIAQRREERQARLRELQDLQDKARPPPRSPELEAEKDPEISALLAQRPSLKKRLRPPLQSAVWAPRSTAEYSRVCGAGRSATFCHHHRRHQHDQHLGRRDDLGFS